MNTPVAGTCPGCGTGGLLYVAANGHVRCAATSCPDPTLVAELLDDPGPVRHVVTFAEGRWRSIHTLRCRVEGLEHCPIDAVLQHQGAPLGPGTFEVDLAGGSLWFRPICCECGYTWDRACGTGCWWAPDHHAGGPICSSCAERLGLPTTPAADWPTGPTSIEVPVGAGT